MILPLPEPPADEILTIRAQLDGARAELHEAQRLAALLDVDGLPGPGPVGVARDVIERDLAARRVAAWVAVLDRLRSEARRLGLFE